MNDHIEDENNASRRFWHSRGLGWLANLPGISWFTRTVVRRWVRREMACRRIPPDVALNRAATEGLHATLYDIVRDVVEVLGYTGAMVATYEQGDSLPVRALYVDPAIATQSEICHWEEQISATVGHPISITDPQVARVYIYDETYRDNLSVQAARQGGPVTSDKLYDLFRPIAPAASQHVVQGIQQALGVEQVIAVPFFLETYTEDGPTRELVGNLFAANRAKISPQDVLVLSAFGRQAAAAIGSERRRVQIEIAQQLSYRLHTSLRDECQLFDWIARGVVEDLGYAGAMVAPLEQDGALPVWAIAVDPELATPTDIARWEQRLSDVMGRPVSLSDPNIAQVYVNQPAYQDNLSVRAAQAGHPITSDTLYDLFRPVLPESARAIVQGIQEAMEIRQVIAVPFFLETLVDGAMQRALVGNLFAASQSRAFQRSEIDLLRAFGQQAAAGIHNARLYRVAEEQRRAAQVFGRMAFSAATAVHALRNHIGLFRVHLDLLEKLPPELLQQQLQKSHRVGERLDQAAAMLDSLGEPWRPINDEVIDVNACVRTARQRILAIAELEDVRVQFELSEEPLFVKTSFDMLTEAFRVLIKNACEAVVDKGAEGLVQVESWLDAPTSIAARIQDNGVGISPDNARRIFDIGWTTKKTGMGFGLFWTRDYITGLGGHIEVQSVLQEGTTFLIHLPFWRDGDADQTGEEEGA